MYSLCIETSTSLCSVALGYGEECIDVIEINDKNQHSEKLHILIKEIMTKNKISFKDLSFVCTSSGPGSYTGLRIGAASAKTLAYILKISLVSISSLQTQSLHFILNKSQFSNSSYIISTMNGRHNKIYLGIYSFEGLEIKSADSFYLNSESIRKLNDEFLKDVSQLLLIGSGANLFMKEFQKSLLLPHSGVSIEVYPDILPSAKGMISEGYKKFSMQSISNFVYFEPRYI